MEMPPIIKWYHGHPIFDQMRNLEFVKSLSKKTILGNKARIKIQNCNWCIQPVRSETILKSIETTKRHSQTDSITDS